MTQFAHIGLSVSDLERSTRFYQDAFGFEPFFAVERKATWIADGTGYVGAHLRFQHMRLPSGMHLELIQYEHPTYEGGGYQGAKFIKGHVHFCLFVDDIEAAMQRAVKAGAFVVSKSAPVTIPEGPNTGAKFVFLEDHDFISIELFQKAKP